MIQIRTCGSRICLLVAFALTSTGTAVAEEKKSPMMPGASVGNAAGALPPEGLYLDTEVTIEQGKVVDGNGRVAKTPGGTNIKSFQVDVAPSLLWVPGVKVLGADYGVSVTQPYAWLNTDFGGASTGGDSTSGKGYFNTILTPAILSWNVGHDLFVGTGLSVYLKTGHFAHKYSAEQGREVLTNGSYANNFWTFQPNFAVSYLADGWNLTANNIVDFNTKNDVTHYASGNTYYLDLTATRKIGRWTVGAIGNFLQQYESDKVNGAVVDAVDGFSSRGNKGQYVAMGPLVAYDFEKVTLRLRYLQPVHAENQGNIAFIRLDLSIPID